MFYDTGIGKEGYSIIGQGQIDRILSTRPEEARELFDEATGIVKFKKRKKTAEKKLDDEKQNLLRVNDILTELEKQVGPLERQAEKAKEYLKKKETLKEFEIHEIPYRNLLYIMSVGNNIEIHFQDSHLNLSARHTFSKTVAPLLTDERFLTCARGIVVNLSHVKDIQKDGFLMDNGEFVPISRRLYPSVKNTYIDFQFEHILS